MLDQCAGLISQISGERKELVYLTYFGNFNNDTHVDTPTIGNATKFNNLTGTTDNYTSNYIGDSKIFTPTLNDPTWYATDSLGTDSYNEFSLEFLATPFFGSNWASVAVSNSNSSRLNRICGFYVGTNKGSMYVQRRGSTFFCNITSEGTYDSPLDSTCNSNVCDVVMNENFKEEHFYYIVISKKKNLFKLFYDGNIIHTERLDISDLRFAYQFYNSHIKIAQFAVFNYDRSNGDGQGSTYPVPNAPYMC